MTEKVKIILLLYFFSFPSFSHYYLCYGYKGQEGKISEDAKRLSCEADLNNLIKSLNRGDVDERREAARILCDLKCVNSVSSLIKALKDNDRTVRGYAAFALGEIKDVQAIPFLKLLLNDRNEVVRLSAIEALGKMREGCSKDDLKMAEDKLIEILKKKEKQPAMTVEASMHVMRYVGTERSVPYIIDVMENKDYSHDPSLLLPALENLKNIGTKEATEYIKKYAFENNKDYPISSRVKAIEILGEIGNSDIIKNLERLRSDAECQSLVEAAQQAIDMIKKR